MAVLDELNKVFSNYYALYLKTHNYHWHVEGVHFQSLHVQFQEQYEDLALVVDLIAERIVMLEGKVPATFNEIMKLSEVKDGDSYKKAAEMVADLVDGHKMMVGSLKKLEDVAASDGDSVTADMAIARSEIHQKTIWMMSAFLKG